MGLLDKIKDNAKTISMKAIESTREYDEEYLAQQASSNDQSAPAASVAIEEPQLVTPTPVDTSDASDGSAQSTDEQQSNKADETENKKTEEVKNQTKTENESEKPARKSKITEIPKEKYEQAKKPYTPHYKAGTKNAEAKESKENKATEDKKEKKKITPKSHTHSSKIIDVAPNKPEDNVQKAIYARERATMAALSTQRRMNGTVPLYATSHMNFKTRVFINRIEYSGSFGKTILPIEKVSWVKLRHGGTGVIIETDENKRVVLVIKPADRLTFADAVIKVQAMKPKMNKPVDQSVRLDQLEKFGDSIDEIEKLAKLYDKGIITEEEFEAKKKQILGI